MATKKFTPQASNDSGVRVKPSDLVNTLIVVEVLEFRPLFKTRYAPEGKPAVRLNVASVESGKVAPSQIWSNPGIVDALTPYVGSVIICKLENKQSGSSGYRYIAVAGVSDEEHEQGNEFLSKNPDLFKPAPAPEAPEPVAAGHW